MTKNFRCFLLGLCLIFQNLFTANAQQQEAVYDSLSENAKAFYRYLPKDYPEAGVKYPMILFVHGYGEIGPGTAATLPKVLRHGPPKLINNGTFPTSFTVAGKTYKFIIISPQFTGFPSVNDINNTINYAIAHYPIDLNRIYLTGLSMGGGAAWYYPGYNTYFSSRIAATVPICGATEATQSIADNIANANLPVWATHNDGDPTVSVNITNTLVNLINNRPNPPIPLAKKTIFISNSHDAFTQTYDPNFKEDGLNIYEWMLQYKRNFSVLAVGGLSFSVTPIQNNTKVHLSWQSLTETNMSGYTVMKSEDGTHFSEIGFVPTQALNGNGASYSFVDSLATRGKSFYKLKMIETNGFASFSVVKSIELQGTTTLMLYPNPVNNMMHLRSNKNMNNAKLIIYNHQGLQVAKYLLSGNNSASVNLKFLPSGAYVGKVFFKDATEILKFIKP